MDVLTSCAFEESGDPPEAAPRPGDVVSGKYEIKRLLGEGGMGLVFEAIHTRLRRRVALKFLRPEVLALPDAVERFEREARAAVRIDGPHVARVLDVDRTPSGAPYMVMELLDGHDLEAELRTRGKLPIDEAVDLALQTCAAIAAAHAAGVVHRDLKPSNVFLCAQEGRRVVKVVDFGISKSLGDDEPLDRGGLAALGTPRYMSPEQVRSSGDVDARTDVWSLGVVLFEMLAGEAPFHGTTTAAIAAIVADATPDIRELCPEVPPALERVLRKAMSKDPRGRHANAYALGAELAALKLRRRRLGRPDPSLSASLPSLAVSCIRRVPGRASRHVRTAVAACAFAVLVSTGGLTLVRTRGGDDVRAAAVGSPAARRFTERALSATRVLPAKRSARAAAAAADAHLGARPAHPLGI